MDAKTEARFWAKVRLGSPGECWEWTASRNATGYGQFCFGGTKRRAHRVAYALTHGEIPAGMCALHRCDNPPCVNPAHLFLGTQEDNNADRDEKGRQRSPCGDRHWTRTHPELMNPAIGDRNGSRTHPELVPRGSHHWTRMHPERVARGEHVASAKLIERVVLEILALKGTGIFQRVVAERFGISQMLVSLIWRGKRWAHITESGDTK